MEELKTLKNVDVSFTFEDDDNLTLTISSGDEFFDFTLDVHEMCEMRYEKGIGQEYSSAEFDDVDEFLKMMQRILGNKLSYQEIMEKYFPKKKEEKDYLIGLEKWKSAFCNDCKKLISEGSFQ